MRFLPGLVVLLLLTPLPDGAASEPDLAGWRIVHAQHRGREWSAALARDSEASWIHLKIRHPGRKEEPAHLAPLGGKHIKEITRPDGRVLTVRVWDAAGIRQVPENVPPRRLCITFHCRRPETGVEIRVQRWFDVTPDETTKAGRKKRLDDAGSDPAGIVMDLLLAREITLDQKTLVGGAGDVFASVNGAEQKKLSTSRKYKGGGNHRLNLPAKPGDRVRITVRDAGAGRVVVTSRGIRREPVEKFPVGISAGLGDATVELDGDGRGTFPEFEVPDPRRIRLQTVKGEVTGRSKRTDYLYLRWGRPEERWMDRGDFPVPTITKPAHDSVLARCILDDLEQAWDPDRSGWWNGRGDSELYRPRWPEVASLRHVKLSGHPRLNALLAGFSPAKAFAGFVADSSEELQHLVGTTDEPVTAKVFIARTSDGQQDRVLFRPLGPGRWFHPRAVHALAVLWETRADLRKENALPKVLGFWIEAMKERPEPLNLMSGKGSGPDDLRLESRLLTIAALRRGARLLSNEEFAATARAHWHRMEAQMEERGWLRALRKATAAEPSPWRRTVVRGVGVYGQTCALRGDMKGQAAAVQWVRAALLRNGGENDGPFTNYRDASFGDRLVLLGMIAGKTPLLDPPPAD